MFPEGTRSRDGRVARFKGGSFYLALEAGLPVVPLSVVGSRHVMLKGRLATYPGDVQPGRPRADRHDGPGRHRPAGRSASASAHHRADAESDVTRRRSRHDVEHAVADSYARA